MTDHVYNKPVHIMPRS